MPMTDAQRQHKFRVIKAWQEGRPIQYIERKGKWRNEGRNFVPDGEATVGVWRDYPSTVTTPPGNNLAYFYRIKE